MAVGSKSGYVDLPDLNIVTVFLTYINSCKVLKLGLIDFSILTVG